VGRTIPLRRVVITGIGAVTPIGNEMQGLWQGILEGRSGGGIIASFDHSSFPVHIACHVKSFDPDRWFNAKDARRLDPFCLYALSTAEMAIQDAGLDISREDPERCGCVFASGIGGLLEIETVHRTFLERGVSKIHPFFIPKLMINAAAGQIAIRYKLQGPNYAVTSACASSLHALGCAFREIRLGEADLVIAGGAEAAITGLGIGGFCAMRALSTRNDDPATASRPFNLDRDGFVMGEGAGALVFEEAERAVRRGARIYAEVAGFGMTDDAHHIAAPEPTGLMSLRAMEKAVLDGGFALDEIDYINAHGTSTPLNDAMETRSVKALFGDHARKLAVSSSKSQLGHLLGASGAVETAITALAVYHQIAPPTINQISPDPECDLDYVPNEARPMRIRAALSNSFGFGGHNASISIRKHE